MTIRSWLDPISHMRRCDRTERTDAPRAATVIVSQIGHAALGHNIFCMPTDDEKRLVDVRFMKVQP